MELTTKIKRIVIIIIVFITALILFQDKIRNSIIKVQIIHKIGKIDIDELNNNSIVVYTDINKKVTVTFLKDKNISNNYNFYFEKYSNDESLLELVESKGRKYCTLSIQTKEINCENNSSTLDVINAL